MRQDIVVFSTFSRAAGVAIAIVLEGPGEAAEDVGLSTYHSPWDDIIYIGMSYSDIKDNETGKEFKTRVEKIFDSLFGNSNGCGFMEEAWRDG